ncbi:MAG TPA: DUF3014 domain-containing protein [Vicinamibacterales bacterium]|nr:DUF3014 domain-containing protein [Vicinamibacterales bacterium]
MSLNLSSGTPTAGPEDYDLRTTDGEPPLHERPRLSGAPPTAPVGIWIAVALLAIAAGAAAYVLLGRRAPAAPVKPAPLAAADSASPRSLGGEADRIVLPPLGDSDPVVRTLVQQLSRHPAVAAWLATNGLIRNFVVVVANAAEGVTPAQHLRALRPTSDFGVVDREGRLYIDPRSYDRYASIADAVASIDAAGAARLYATLKPRIEEAYRELGYPDGEFDRPLERALKVLIATPVVGDPIRVRPKGIGYAYTDARLEDLSGPQKQLLRMGSAHVLVVEQALRRIAAALGIPEGELAPNR